ncbi:MAG: lysophospholipase, partial [Saprospiraceae bacterium]|nr:lysophospholipase [Saprospiraceae bacterium]
MEDDYHSTSLHKILDYDIAIHQWTPPETTKAVVGLIHGLAEHAGRYTHVAKWFQQEDIALIGFDLPGHGLSSGKRGHVPSYDTYLEVIDQFKVYVQAQFPDVPLFLYGHSLGGNLLLNYILRFEPQLAGAIVSAPAIKTYADLPKWVRGLIRNLTRVVPKLTVPTGLKSKWLSRDAEVVRQANEDPYRFSTATISLGVGVLDAAELLYNHRHESAVPILLMHGTADRINFLKGSQYFSTNFEGDLALKTWEGFYHELHNEPEKEMVLKEMVQWIYNIL